MAASLADDDTWSFPFVRTFFFDENVIPKVSGGLRDPGVAIDTPEAALVLLCVPLAIDLALLPFTLPHDLCNW